MIVSNPDPFRHFIIGRGGNLPIIKWRNGSGFETRLMKGVGETMSGHAQEKVKTEAGACKNEKSTCTIVLRLMIIAIVAS